MAQKFSPSSWQETRKHARGRHGTREWSVKSYILTHRVRGSSLYVTLREAWTNLPSQWQTFSNWAIPTPTKPHFLVVPLSLEVVFSQTTTFPFPLSNHLDPTITLYESPTSPPHQLSLFTFLVSVVIHGCVLMYEDLEMEASNENEYMFLLNSLDKSHSILFFSNAVYGPVKFIILIFVLLNSIS